MARVMAYRESGAAAIAALMMAVISSQLCRSIGRAFNAATVICDARSGRILTAAETYRGASACFTLMTTVLDPCRNVADAACLTSTPPATLTARLISVAGDAKTDCPEKRASASANINPPTHCEKLDLFIIIKPPD